MNREKTEKFGLNLSIFVTLFMSALGIGFGVSIQSEAILLDGFFNVVGSVARDMPTKKLFRRNSKRSLWCHFHASLDEPRSRVLVYVCMCISPPPLSLIYDAPFCRRRSF